MKSSILDVWQGCDYAPETPSENTPKAVIKQSEQQVALLSKLAMKSRLPE